MPAGEELDVCAAIRSARNTPFVASNLGIFCRVLAEYLGGAEIGVEP